MRLVVLRHGGPVAHGHHDALRALSPNQLIQRHFQPGVERGSGLVEERRLRLVQHDARERDPLLLTGREHLGPVLDLVEAVDEMR